LDDPLNWPLEKLRPMSTRLWRCLTYDGWTTVGDIVALTERELRRIQGFGNKTAKELKDKLAEHGLSLARDPDARDAPRRYGQFSAEERAGMFMAWCAMHGFGLSGWPEGAAERLADHIRAGERPFPLKEEEVP
jgi:hypothetical protein